MISYPPILNSASGLITLSPTLVAAILEENSMLELKVLHDNSLISILVKHYNPVTFYLDVGIPIPSF